MIDRESFVELMSGVCAPVTVVTAMTADGEPHGTTVSSLASLSLDPPLVSFALDRRSELLIQLQPGERVGVNILAAHQQELASTFARRRRGPGLKFDGVTWALRAGLPYLPESSGWTAGHIERHVDGGDTSCSSCVSRRQSRPPPRRWSKRAGPSARTPFSLTRADLVPGHVGRPSGDDECHLVRPRTMALAGLLSPMLPSPTSVFRPTDTPFLKN